MGGKLTTKMYLSFTESKHQIFKINFEYLTGGIAFQSHEDEIITEMSSHLRAKTHLNMQNAQVATESHIIMIITSKIIVLYFTYCRYTKLSMNYLLRTLIILQVPPRQKTKDQKENARTNESETPVNEDKDSK